MYILECIIYIYIYTYSVGTHKFTKSIAIENCIKLKNCKRN